MGTARILAAAALLFAFTHCALVFDPDDLGPGTPLVEGGSTGDAPVASTDAPITDAGSSDGRGPTGLDDRVPLPDLDASPCASPTFVDRACRIGDACRMATRDSGRCESCDNRCLRGVGESCTNSYDCDSLAICFRGRCTTSCTPGGHECGRVDACLDVGYEGLGLCDPSSF